MDASAELTSHITGGTRVIVIAEKEVDFRPASGNNLLVLLKIMEGSLASGGRGGGFGERKVVGVFVFGLANGTWSKLFETTDEAKLGEFEVPYSVSRLPFTLSDGTESMGYGVVDPDLVHQMTQKAGLPSSP
jgi:hypothetical protein